MLLQHYRVLGSKRCICILPYKLSGKSTPFERCGQGVLNTGPAPPKLDLIWPCNQVKILEIFGLRVTPGIQPLAASDKQARWHYSRHTSMVLLHCLPVHQGKPHSGASDGMWTFLNSAGLPPRFPFTVLFLYYAPSSMAWRCSSADLYSPCHPWCISL